MRNVLLVIASALLLTACDKKYCWNCELRTTTIVVSNTTDTARVFEIQPEEVCDKSEREINILQEERTDQTVTEDQGTATYKLYMYGCLKQ